MKTTNQTFLTIMLFLLLGGLFGFALAKALKTKDKSSNILKVLQENCDCKEINQIIYAKGIQYGKNGLSTERAEYELVDCQFTSVEQEIERINVMLHKKIENYTDLDLLEIEFENENANQTFIIKNGKIQEPKN